MHHTKECLEHATCIVDQMEEEIPLYTNLPEPLPIPSEVGADRNKNSFVKGVKEGRVAETGPKKPDARTIVTQYSLDHYLAQ